MDRHVAFDVSKPTSERVIVDEAGHQLASRKPATDSSAMAVFVTKDGANVASAGIEEGSLSIWLYQGLKAAGWPVVCIGGLWRRCRRASTRRLSRAPSMTHPACTAAVPSASVLGWPRGAISPASPTTPAKSRAPATA